MNEWERARRSVCHNAVVWKDGEGQVRCSAYGCLRRCLTIIEDRNDKNTGKDE